MKSQGCQTDLDQALSSPVGRAVAHGQSTLLPQATRLAPERQPCLQLPTERALNPKPPSQPSSARKKPTPRSSLAASASPRREVRAAGHAAMRGGAKTQPDDHVRPSESSSNEHAREPEAPSEKMASPVSRVVLELARHADKPVASKQDHDKKVQILYLVNQTIGMQRHAMSLKIAAKLPAIIGAHAAHLAWVDAKTNEFLEFPDGDGGRVKFVDVREGGIAAEALRKKSLVQVKDEGTIDGSLGPFDLEVGGSEHSRSEVLCVPILDNSTTPCALLTIGSNAERFSESDVETTEWLAVLLGNVMHHNEQLYVKQDQLALVLRIASHAVTLFQQGCVVEDPRFWMSAFDAQIAQIALVHREEEEVEPLLYCISSDASKDEVSMITFPCTGRHGWMLGKRDGEPWVCEHAEEVRGLDRRIDLGGSEWVGKTSLMLVPVMERKEQDPQVMAIVMAASTKTVMHETHAMLMKAMAMAVRDQIRELLDGWKRDEKKIFKQSFVRSREFEDSASPMSQLEEEMSEQSLHLDLTSLADFSPRIEESSSPREAMPQDNIYAYSKAGIAKMLDMEETAKSSRRGW
mmetsp:Transcript_20307/g.67787  ORF Transcript_20307/g.67787 Transcript_20307/m.67787 type:complete len:577 (-) Transcript_20307:253-1983(-)